MTIKELRKALFEAQEEARQAEYACLYPSWYGSDRYRRDLSMANAKIRALRNRIGELTSDFTQPQRS